MRLFVRHRSEYLFSEAQARLIQLLRVTPGNHHGQSIVSWHIEVDRDARLKPHRDGYGNEATMLYIDGPIERIALEVAGEVLTEDRAGMVSGAAETLPPAYFLQPTALTAADAAMRDFLAGMPRDDDPLAAAHWLNEALGDYLTPVAPTPDSDTHAAACFAEARADAQGAAHLLIALARTGGTPARYVAGHCYRADAEDGDAAHGWAELWIEGYGWIGFDPLDGRCPGDAHIRVAIGLDHTQAAPLSGLRVGGGGEALRVEVHVGPEPARQG